MHSPAAPVRARTACLTFDFIYCSIVSEGVAAFAWAMNHWLKGFTYRTDINFWVFTIPGAFAVLVATLTVGFQAIKAALLSPAATLKNE